MKKFIIDGKSITVDSLFEMTNETGHFELAPEARKQVQKRGPTAFLRWTHHAPLEILPNPLRSKLAASRYARSAFVHRRDRLVLQKSGTQTVLGRNQ